MSARAFSDPFEVLYSVTDLPIFQNLMFHSRSDARACVRGDVNLVRDPDTGLIFNRSFRSELMQYDANYQNEQAVSGVFRAHLNVVAAVIEKHFSRDSLIEVGCGKGHFLELLQSRGCRITGLDPTYEGTNPAVIRQYFSTATNLTADGIVLRHVLEHVPNPVDFLMNLRDANGGGGKIYIEVPCLDWICEHRAWFDIFYEHVNYFRLLDFHRLFATIYESGHVFSGQYLYVVADLGSVRTPVRDPSDDFRFPEDFLATVERNVERLTSRNSGGSAIWGGASKGVTFSSFMERRGVKIQVVVDVNPAKHGKYLPGTGHRVASPAEAMEILPRGADVVVMNRNYLDEIRRLTADQYNYFTVEHD